MALETSKTVLIHVAGFIIKASPCKGKRKGKVRYSAPEPVKITDRQGKRLTSHGRS